MKIKCIYKITTPLNEVYIGGTTNFKNRMAVYKYNKNRRQRHIAESIKKYGFDSHEVKIIHELPTDVSQEVLDTYEQLYMDLYRDAGVNLLNIKGAGQNGKHSQETIQMFSDMRKGRVFSEQAKLNMGLSRKGEKSYIAKKVIDTSNGRIYSCIRDAAKSVELSHSGLSLMLRGKLKNRTTLKYL